VRQVSPEHHPLFRAALPKDSRVEILQMLGGVAAKVDGHLFAGLFGRSTMVLLTEADRTAALALDGAELFDPMDNGRSGATRSCCPRMCSTNRPSCASGSLVHSSSPRRFPRKTKAAAKKPQRRSPQTTRAGRRR